MRICMQRAAQAQPCSVHPMGRCVPVRQGMDHARGTPCRAGSCPTCAESACSGLPPLSCRGRRTPAASKFRWWPAARSQAGSGGHAMYCSGTQSLQGCTLLHDSCCTTPQPPQAGVKRAGLTGKQGYDALAPALIVDRTQRSASPRPHLHGTLLHASHLAAAASVPGAGGATAGGGADADGQAVRGAGDAAVATL